MSIGSVSSSSFKNFQLASAEQRVSVTKQRAESLLKIAQAAEQEVVDAQRVANSARSNADSAQGIAQSSTLSLLAVQSETGTQERSKAVSTSKLASLPDLAKNYAAQIQKKSIGSKIDTSA